MHVAPQVLPEPAPFCPAPSALSFVTEVHPGQGSAKPSSGPGSCHTLGTLPAPAHLTDKQLQLHHHAPRTGLGSAPPASICEAPTARTGRGSAVPTSVRGPRGSGSLPVLPPDTRLPEPKSRRGPTGEAACTSCNGPPGRPRPGTGTRCRPRPARPAAGFRQGPRLRAAGFSPAPTSDGRKRAEAARHHGGRLK